MKKHHTITLAFLTLLVHMKLLAQDVDIDLADDTPGIFEKPVFWVVAAIVLIIIAYILRMKK